MVYIYFSKIILGAVFLRMMMMQRKMMMQRQMDMNTPESIPVGVMATMLINQIKRAKNMQAAFVPYRALDSSLTPQNLPGMETPSKKMLDLVNPIPL